MISCALPSCVHPSGVVFTLGHEKQPATHLRRRDEEAPQHQKEEVAHHQQQWVEAPHSGERAGGQPVFRAGESGQRLCRRAGRRQGARLLRTAGKGHRPEGGGSRYEG